MGTKVRRETRYPAVDYDDWMVLPRKSLQKPKAGVSFLSISWILLDYLRDPEGGPTNLFSSKACWVSFV